MWRLSLLVNVAVHRTISKYREKQKGCIITYSIIILARPLLLLYLDTALVGCMEVAYFPEFLGLGIFCIMIKISIRDTLSHHISTSSQPPIRKAYTVVPIECRSREWPCSAAGTSSMLKIK